MGICFAGHLTPKVSKSISSTNYSQKYDNGVTSVKDFPKGSILDEPNLRVFAFEELKSVTRNFKIELPVREGELGRFYKGWVEVETLNPANSELGMAVLVNKIQSFTVSNKWQYMINFLGKLSHPNLVKLLGYYWKDEVFYWVQEYIPNRSLDNYLFKRQVAHEPLSWCLRLKVLIGVARGLAFLHTLENNIIYRDLKPSNIFLDTNFNAKLSDFSLAIHGPSDEESYVETEVMGTYGYAAPEYIATGQLNVKSDVYSYGVVFLEILSGLRTVDRNRPQGQYNLVDWARPILADRRKLTKWVDPQLTGQYQSKEVLKAGHLCQRCLSGDPNTRPSMKEIVEILENIEALQSMPRKS